MRRSGTRRSSIGSDVQEIRQKVGTWIEATKAGDADPVLSLMADDIVFLVTSQPPMIGKSACAAALKAQMKQNGMWVLARDANMLSPVHAR